MQRTTETRAWGPGLLAIVMGVACLATRPLEAHDPGLSALQVVVEPVHVVAMLSVAATDAEGLQITPDVLHLAIDDVRLNGALTETAPEPTGGRRFVFRYRRGPGTTLTITSGLPARLPRGHRELVSVHDESGRLIAERMIDARASSIVATIVSRPDSPTGGAGHFFALGVQHIISGYDHLLFLAAMLLAVPGVARAAAIVTAFSAAHALALVVAAFGLIHVPGEIVEPLIAASMIWVAVENLLRRTTGNRWLPAFAFGLIHGLAFAGALAELGAGGSGASLAVRLGLFNMGIEAGQLAFALLTVPLICYARRTPHYLRLLQTAGSVCVALAGGYWLVERLT